MLQQKCNENRYRNIEYAKQKNKHNTYIHIYIYISLMVFFVCLFVFLKASYCSLIKTGAPWCASTSAVATASEHTGSRREWRRLTVSYIVAAPIIRLGRFFHFHLEVCQSRGFLRCWQHFIAQMRGHILVLQIIWLPTGQAPTSPLKLMQPKMLQ